MLGEFKTEVYRTIHDGGGGIDQMSPLLVLKESIFTFLHYKSNNYAQAEERASQKEWVLGESQPNSRPSER